MYSKDAEADAHFFRDALKFSFVDAGHGWLIFRLPEAESAFHPAQAHDRHEIYFMCDNLRTQLEALRARGVECSAVTEERWGSITKMRLPGGGEIGLYRYHSYPCRSRRAAQPT